MRVMKSDKNSTEYKQNNLKRKYLEENSKDRDRISSCNMFPQHGQKKHWEKKRVLAYFGHNSWWHMKCAQHAAQNP